MSVGTAGQQRVLSTVPAQPFEVSPEGFFAYTSKEVFSPTFRFTYPGGGTTRRYDLPHQGVVGELNIAFEGTVANASSGVEDPLWAYRMIKSLTVSGGGKSKLFNNVTGMDLHVERFIKNPALQRNTEFYSTSTDENGAFRVKWNIPIATDMSSLASALWVQTQAQNFQVEITWATLAELGITGGTAAVTGNVTIQMVTFEAPFDPNDAQRVLTPDLTRPHGFITTDKSFSNTGDVTIPMQKEQGVLQRLLLYVDLGASGGTANPVDWAAASPAVTGVSLQYGGTEKPYDVQPAWLQAALNSEHYGAPLPKGYIAFDFMKENGPRDAWLLPGVTDPRVVITIAAGTSLAANSGVHLCQEMIFAS